MVLTDIKRKQLISKVNTLPIETVLKYVMAGAITLDELTGINQDRKEFIEKKLQSMPNPDEQQEWAAIKKEVVGPNYDESHLTRVNQYIQKWGASLPNGNHVEEAKQLKEKIKKELGDIFLKKEEEDWQKVDPFSLQSLVVFLNKYPQTHHLDEIDESMWNDVINKENVNEVQLYLTHLPQGRHVQDAQAILGSLVTWDAVRTANDIFIMKDYIRNNPDSPFLQQAKLKLMGMKQNEIHLMQADPNRYEVTRLLRLLNEGVFSDNELIMADVMTANILAILKGDGGDGFIDINRDLPDINQAIESSTPECKEGYTDVYFFGVPSTGKTCVLMGLSRSRTLNVNLAHGGGEYAAALQQYTDVGLTLPRTPGTFVTTLEATIRDPNAKGAVHKINLVEMSGEEFAFGIANNPEHVFTFEDMGTGATELLNNNNRKVFFLIIDPTANVVRINREVVVGYDEETGEKITEKQYCAVNQRTLIQKMVNLLEDDGNAAIMKKVDSIHVIVTKSDTLGNVVDREQKALDIFNRNYADDILQPLIELGEKYNINMQMTPKYHPKLYTFSLGKFYVGKLYEYESTDSERLVRAIRNSTASEKKKTMWDKVKDIVN